jgi:signal transduction histidine kinase
MASCCTLSQDPEAVRTVPIFEGEPPVLGAPIEFDRRALDFSRVMERVIDHLAHELGTPLSIISGVLARVSRKLERGDLSNLKETIERGNRSVKRLFALKSMVEDIMNNKPAAKEGSVLKWIEDALSLVEEAHEAETEERGRVLLGKIAQRLNSLNPPEDRGPEEIRLSPFLQEIGQEAAGAMGARRLEIVEDLEEGLVVRIPVNVLKKVCGGLVKNAIENTPDEGRVDVRARYEKEGTRIEVRDYGIGIHPLDRKAIFSGFFHIQENSHYATKRPYEFNAGGTGTDLLRMKVFSERFRFSIGFESTRCRFIPEDSDPCPGRISKCAFVQEREECLSSGGSLFWIMIPRERSPWLNMT